MAFPSTPVLDNFNRATIGANWTGARLDANGLPNPNGTQLPGDGAFDDGIWNPVTFKYPYEIFVTVATINGAGALESCMLYFIDSSGNGYSMSANGNGAIFGHVDAFNQNTLSGPAWTLANGDVVGFTATSNGTTVSLQAYKNGVAVGTPVTDTLYPVLATNRNVGLEIGNAVGIRLDDFGGGTTLVPSVAPRTTPLLMRMLPLWQAGPLGFPAPAPGAPVVVGNPDNPHPVVTPRTTYY